MGIYIREGNRTQALRASQYGKCYQFGVTNFLVRHDALTRKANNRNDEEYQLSHGSGIIDAFERYTQNQLELFRGLSTCHFSWSGLTHGLLESEGYYDDPNFTMGNTDAFKTRWLPTALTNEEAQAIGFGQDLDRYTRALSLSEPVFVGISVKIPINSAFNCVCWYNEGELGVRGPLAETQYRINTMVWLDAGQPVNRPWPTALSNTDLPAQRPYKPGVEREIDRWWAKSQDWADRAATHDPVIASLRKDKMRLVDIYD